MHRQAKAEGSTESVTGKKMKAKPKKPKQAGKDVKSAKQAGGGTSKMFQKLSMSETV